MHRVSVAERDRSVLQSDLVLLGALLAMASYEAGGASRPLQVPETNESTDSESFGHALQSMSGASNEVLMLATLAEDLHRSLTGNFR